MPHYPRFIKAVAIRSRFVQAVVQQSGADHRVRSDPTGLRLVYLRAPTYWWFVVIVAVAPIAILAVTQFLAARPDWSSVGQPSSILWATLAINAVGVEGALDMDRHSHDQITLIGFGFTFSLFTSVILGLTIHVHHVDGREIAVALPWLVGAIMLGYLSKRNRRLSTARADVSGEVDLTVGGSGPNTTNEPIHPLRRKTDRPHEADPGSS